MIDPGMPASVGEKQTYLSFGEALRRERELRRILLRDVGEATKINIRYLEALERNDFTYLPAGAFTRGFIRSYARFIGADETEMINAYLDELRQQERQTGKRSRDDEAAAAPLSFPGSARRPAPRRRLLLWTVLALLLLLAAAASLALPRILNAQAERTTTSATARGTLDGPAPARP
jgi:cytoskeletal protein RodZ